MGEADLKRLKTKNYSVYLFLYSLFLAAVMSGYGSHDYAWNLYVFMSKWVFSMIAISIIGLPIYIIGHEYNRARVKEALKESENSTDEETELVFTTGFDDYYRGNLINYFRSPQFFLMWIAILYINTLYMLNFFSRDLSIADIVIFIFLASFSLYPVTILLISAYVMYKKQEKVFGRQAVRITSEGIYEENELQRTLHKKIYDIQISGNMVLIFVSPANIISIKNETFKDRKSLNIFVAKAYALLNDEKKGK